MGTSIGYGTSRGANQRTGAGLEGAVDAGGMAASLPATAARTSEASAAMNSGESPSAAIIETRQRGFDVAHHRADILRVQVEFLHDDFERRGRAWASGTFYPRGDAAPFLEAAQGGGEGVMRVERQQHEHAETGGTHGL